MKQRGEVASYFTCKDQILWYACRCWLAGLQVILKFCILFDSYDLQLEEKYSLYLSN